MIELGKIEVVIGMYFSRNAEVIKSIQHSILLLIDVMLTGRGLNLITAICVIIIQIYRVIFTLRNV